MTIQISRHTIIGAPSMRITRPKSAAAFSPLDLSPVLWLDFSDASTLYQDSAKTTPVASDGDVIGRAEDKSGNGNHATQGTTANKPLYKTGIQNGLSVGRWDGVNDYLDATLGVDQPHSVYLVANSLGNATNTDYFYDQVALSASRVVMGRKLDAATDNAFGIFAGTSIVSVEDAALSDTAVLFEGEYNGASSRLLTNGSERATGNAGANAIASMRFGSRFNANGVNHLLGDIMSVLVFSSILSTADRQSLETYLNDKWAVF